MFIFLSPFPFFDKKITDKYKKNRAFSKKIIKNFIENTLFFIYLEKNIWQISPCS